MTVDKIITAIYTWGFYPALVLLREEQQKENFENCEVIKKALDIVGEKIELPSKVDIESMEETFAKIKSLTSKPELLDKNMEYYIDGFKKQVTA